jgi:hypothetical protein
MESNDKGSGHDGPDDFMTRLDDLPDELKLQIFGHLDLVALRSLLRVNHASAMLANDAIEKKFEHPATARLARGMLKYGHLAEWLLKADFLWSETLALSTNIAQWQARLEQCLVEGGALVEAAEASNDPSEKLMLLDGKFWNIYLAMQRKLVDRLGDARRASKSAKNA